MVPEDSGSWWLMAPAGDSGEKGLAETPSPSSSSSGASLLGHASDETNSNKEVFHSAKSDFDAEREPILPRDIRLNEFEVSEWKERIKNAFFAGFEREFQSEIERGLYQKPREEDVFTLFDNNRKELRLNNVNWIEEHLKGPARSYPAKQNKTCNVALPPSWMELPYSSNFLKEVLLYLFYQEEMPNRLPLIFFLHLPLLRILSLSYDWVTSEKKRNLIPGESWDKENFCLSWPIWNKFLSFSLHWVNTFSQKLKWETTEVSKALRHDDLVEGKEGVLDNESTHLRSERCLAWGEIE